MIMLSFTSILVKKEREKERKKYVLVQNVETFQWRQTCMQKNQWWLGQSN